jgi:hypothetical protein
VSDTSRCNHRTVDSSHSQEGLECGSSRVLALHSHGPGFNPQYHKTSKGKYQKDLNNSILSTAQETPGVHTDMCALTERYISMYTRGCIH